MTQKEFDKTVAEVRARHQALIERPNEVREDFYNGVYKRYKYPVLTGDHAPLEWRFDFNPETNPFFQERLGVHAAFNSGAITFGGKVCLMARLEGNDRKSFFAVAESDNGIDNFRFPRQASCNARS